MRRSSPVGIRSSALFPEPHRLERLAMAIVDLVRGIESQRPLNGCHAIFTHVDARLDVARDDLTASVVLIGALVYII